LTHKVSESCSNSIYLIPEIHVNNPPQRKIHCI